MMNEAEQRAAIVAEARTWLGTAYHHRARVKGAGVDCGMLLIAVFARLGLIEDFDPGYYPPDFNLHRGDERYLGWVRRYASEIAGPPLSGDLALYKFGRCFAHGAIVVDWPNVIHAYVKQGCVLANVERESGLSGRQVVFFSIFPSPYPLPQVEREKIQTHS